MEYAYCFNLLFKIFFVSQVFMKFGKTVHNRVHYSWGLSAEIHTKIPLMVHKYIFTTESFKINYFMKVRSHHKWIWGTESISKWKVTALTRVGPRNTFFNKKNYLTKGPPGDKIDIEIRLLVPLLSNLMKVVISTGQKREGQVFRLLFITSEEPNNTYLITLL